MEDLYGTLMDRDHRKNLFEEFDRFLSDERFTIFRFDLECTEKEFYNYLPPWPKTCKFCTVLRKKMDSGEWYCPKTFQILDYYPGPEFKCHAGFVERKRDKSELQRIRTSKERYIGQCLEKGFQIVWRGSRGEACKKYRDGVETWLRQNYAAILKLNVKPYNDVGSLLEKKARLEAELEAVNGALRGHHV